ncbi:MAG: TetR family transcriptional regulator C-terminal domain-containing protein, partial [Bacteroidota bacterium]
RSMAEQLRIQEAYIADILATGQRPPSVLVFMESIGLHERDFYVHYGSFSALEQAIFKGWLDETLDTLAKDEVFQNYGTREKWLALLFTWLETLKSVRSVVVFMQAQSEVPFFGPSYLDQTKNPFKEFAEGLLAEGMERGEVADRFLIKRIYPQWAWAQARYILNFWLADTSKDFEQTDAAVEKLSTFFFDLIEPNAFDSGWDLVKFLWRR